MPIPSIFKLAGTSTPFVPLDAETEAVFTQAKNKLAGAAYTPLLACKQLADETQYLFAANAQTRDMETDPYPVLLRACKSTNGDVRVTNIIDVLECK